MVNTILCRALFANLGPKLSSHFSGRALVDFRAGAADRVRISLHCTNGTDPEAALADLRLLAGQAGLSLRDEFLTRHGVSVDILCEAVEIQPSIVISFAGEAESSERKASREMAARLRQSAAGVALNWLASQWAHCRAVLRWHQLRPAPLK